MEWQEIEPIGTVIRSAYKQKWGTPRQGALTPSASAEILIRFPIAGIAENSRVAIVWSAHLNSAKFNPLKARIKPPKKLEGNRTVGVFATRGVHRPSSLGLTFCRVESVSGNSITVSGADMIEGTPVLSITDVRELEIDSIKEKSIKAPEWTKVVRVQTNFSLGAFMNVQLIADQHSVDASQIFLLVKSILQEDPRSVHSVLKHVEPVYEVEVEVSNGPRLWVIYRHSSCGQIDVLFANTHRVVPEHRGRTEQWLSRLLDKAPFIKQ